MAPEAQGPYSQAIKIKGMLFCSGQLPIDPMSGNLVTDSVAEQTQRVMENLKAVVEASGFTLDDIVKTTIFITDLSFFSEVNKVYESYFKETFPARSTVQVSALPKGASVEIEAIAYR